MDKNIMYYYTFLERKGKTVKKYLGEKRYGVKRGR